MKPLKLIALAALAVLMACSAQRKMSPVQSFRSLMPLLERSEKVDSCLAVLRSIDTAALTRPADKARWALLYTMALDKNYIDTTDLSVLQPAIDRYTRWTHLNRLDKFYTWYYKGRIEENAKTYDASLDSYLHAERYMRATSDFYRTRLYLGFFRDYSKTISFKKAYEASKTALHFSRHADNNDLYANALLTCACASAGVFKHEEADKCLREYDLSSCDSSDALLYRTKMVCYGLRGNRLRDSSEYYFNKYIAAGGAESDALTCLMNCILREDMSGGGELIKKYHIEEPGEGTPASAFYHFRSRIRESEGDIQGALEDMRASDKYLNEEYGYNIYNETAYTADRYHNKLKRIEMILWLSFICFLLVVIVLSWILVSKEKKQQYNVLLQGYDSVRDEYQLFRRYLLNGKEWDSSQPDDISIVKERIEGMGKYFLQTDDAGLCGISRKFVEKIGRKEYYSLINILMALYCHKGHKELKQLGMNDGEMAICALMMMGCSTKEIEFILVRKNIRNDCVEIRKKLGVEDGYLDDFMKKYYDGMTTYDYLKGQ